MDFPKVGGNLPRPARIDEKAVETAQKAAGPVREESPKQAPSAPVGGGDSFERVASPGQSVFSALNAAVAGGDVDALDLAGRMAEKTARAAGELVEDPVGKAAQLVDAMALGFGNTARNAIDHLKEGLREHTEKTGLFDEGFGSEGVAHAIGVVARRVGEKASEMAGDAAEAAAPVADAVAVATEAGGDVVSAVGGAVSDAADAVGDAAGAAWDALTGGGS